VAVTWPEKVVSSFTVKLKLGCANCGAVLPEPPPQPANASAHNIGVNLISLFIIVNIKS
jgi:hypothetical protein